MILSLHIFDKDSQTTKKTIFLLDSWSQEPVTSTLLLVLKNLKDRKVFKKICAKKISKLFVIGKGVMKRGVLINYNLTPFVLYFPFFLWEINKWKDNNIVVQKGCRFFGLIWFCRKCCPIIHPKIGICNTQELKDAPIETRI